MKKFIGSVLATTLILGGCSTMENESKKDTKTETKSVPEEMEASKYVGQGFQPPAEKNAIEFAKKHRKEFEKVGEQLYKDAIHQKGSMRSNDNGDDMSMMVGTVLSGFEYRAQKEKYDNLYKFLKENEKQYQYTGFTKEAINKTQNVGYQNEYFYITYLSRNLKEYRKYYEPLIHKNDKEFKEGMQRARKELNYTANTNTVATLFSTNDERNRKEKINNVIDLSEKIERTKDMPIKNTITTQLGNKLIGTKKARFDDKKVVSFGAFEDE
ncbi:TPA: DUF1672 family protein [Staphylococcus aureus]|nr:DUF1672 family protein [Staphylococcus aureus]HDB5211350.1 DUF1672 family protein [Staphylococcus aureus]HDB5222666.1 DUF1672 family protein [Staphylococcus aureus]HDB5231163.1 DUF1672 family protein [Staphylococcus aureus]HDB5247370.1 DUF1672 family protein [Staphylococcus aureus]